jgi:hypothetical protein
MDDSLRHDRSGGRQLPPRQRPHCPPAALPPPRARRDDPSYRARSRTAPLRQRPLRHKQDTASACSPPTLYRTGDFASLLQRRSATWLPREAGYRAIRQRGSPSRGRHRGALLSWIEGSGGRRSRPIRRYKSVSPRTRAGGRGDVGRAIAGGGCAVREHGPGAPGPRAGAVATVRPSAVAAGQPALGAERGRTSHWPSH